jgi:hypothetical protein
MVWFNIRVGTFNLKYSPLKEKKNEFLPCDKDGNVLKRISGHLEKGYFLNESTSEKHDKAFLLINGKAFDKFARTKETDRYKEVEFNEVFDLVNPKMYLCESEKLLAELQDTGKALKFGISFGGQQTYMAFVFINPLYKQLFMYIGQNKVSEQMLEFTEVQKNKDKLKEMSLIINGIDKAKVEDFIQI